MALPAPAPVRLVIPAIGVDAPITTIATDATGALVPPTSTALVGWFAAGPPPGGTGPALLAGHVDSRGYAPTPSPELRLVTCGGAFDHTARSYLDNVIVAALPADGTGWTLR